MSRLFTSGWENRCEHPQFSIAVCGGEFMPTYTPSFLAGGVNGNGYLQLNCTGNGKSTFLEPRYTFTASDEVFVTLNVKPYFSAEAAIPEYTRVYIRSSAVDDPFYFEMRHAADTIKWDWSGTTESLPIAINYNTWYEVRIHIKAVTTPGPSIVQIWLDSILRFDWSGNNTPQTVAYDILGLYGGTTWTGTGAQKPQTGWDNVFVNNENGAIDNAQCLGHYLIGLPVTGAGAQAELTPSAGANWDCIEEIPPNDADYVYSSVATTRDSYEFTNTPALVGGVPYDVYKFILRGRHNLSVDNPGDGFYPLIRIGGANYLGSGKQGYAAITQWEQIWDLDPSDVDVWEKATVNAMESGEEVM